MKFLQSKEKIILFSSVLFSIIEKSLLTMSLFRMGHVLDMAISSDINGIKEEAIITVVLLLLMWTASLVQIVLSQNFQLNSADTLRMRLAKAIFNQPLSQTIDRPKEYYLNLLSNDIEDYRHEYLSNLDSFLHSVITVIITGFALVRLHYWIFVIAIVLTFIPSIFSKLMVKIIQKTNEIKTKDNESFLAQLNEILYGYEQIKRSNKSETFLNLLGNKNSQRSKTLKRYLSLNYIMQTTMFTIGTLDQLLLIIICSYLVLAGSISAGMIITAVATLANFTDSLSNLLEYAVGMNGAKVYSTKFKPYLNSSLPSLTEVNTPTSNYRAMNCDYIQFKNVSFSFPNKKILNNLSFSLKKGDLVSIIGESGKGKSTLVKLLLKTYNAYEGSIVFMGTNIKDIPEENLYSEIYLVSQDSFIFKASLFDNISMYAESSPNNLDKYSKIIQRVNLLSLVKSVNSDILEPSKLSGGEKQRISIARALFQEPQVIIFDEPDAGLDPQNQKNIHDLILSLEGITRIVITHNRNEEYLNDFNQIVCLDE